MEKARNNSSMGFGKNQEHKEVILEAQRDKNRVHFATLMDMCHLKKCGVGTKITEVQRQSRTLRRHCKRRLWSLCSFYWTSSSASQMTAAKVMEIIARLPGCEEQAADALSAYTQVKLEGAPRLLRIPESERPNVWIRLPRHKCPKSWSNIEDPVVLLERNLYGHPLAGLFVEKTVRRSFIRTWVGESTELWRFFVQRKQGLFLSVHVGDIKMIGKKQNMAPMWKKVMKKRWSWRTNIILDHENLRCTQRECTPNEIVIEEYTQMFESRFSAGAAAEFDSTVTRTGTLSWTAQFLDMCAGLVFSLVFLSQSCSVFLSCDISTVTVLIRGSRELPCCFIVWQFVFAHQKIMCLTIFMRCTVIGFWHGSSWKIQEWEKPHAQTVAWSYDMEGHAQKCVERYCELANRKVEQLYKFQILAWMTITSTRRNWNQLQHCHKFAHTLYWNACTWHELEDLTFCGRSTSLQDQSQNGLRHVTDDWQDWFLTFITRTISDNIVLWETRHSIADWVCSKTQTLLDILRTPNRLREGTGGILCIFGSHTFVPISWMCKKQTSVSHSSTEAEVISLRSKWNTLAPKQT